MIFFRAVTLYYSWNYAHRANNEISVINERFSFVMFFSAPRLIFKIREIVTLIFKIPQIANNKIIKKN